MKIKSSYNKGVLEKKYPDMSFKIFSWEESFDGYIKRFKNGPWVQCNVCLDLNKGLIDPERKNENYEIKKNSNPEFNQILLQFNRLEGNHLADQLYLDHLPPDVRTIAGQYSFYQYEIARFLKESGEYGFDLGKNNPALLFALVNYNMFGINDASYEELKEIAKQKQRDILKWLGFPGYDAVVKIFRKIIPFALNHLTLYRLYSFLSDPENIKKLSYLPYINSEILGLLDPFLLSYLTNKVLHEISLLPERYYNYKYGLDFIMHNNIQIMKEFKIKHKLQSLDGIYYFRVDKMYKKKPEHMKLVTLPPPPFNGVIKENIIIKGINNLEELWKEGKRMRNCVFENCYNISRGNYYIYTADINEEHLDIGLVNNKGQWYIDQISGVENMPPSTDAKEIIFQWLEGYNVSCEYYKIEEGEALAVDFFNGMNVGYEVPF